MYYYIEERIGISKPNVIPTPHHTTPHLTSPHTTHHLPIPSFQLAGLVLKGGGVVSMQDFGQNSTLFGQIVTSCVFDVKRVGRKCLLTLWGVFYVQK